MKAILPYLLVWAVCLPDSLNAQMKFHLGLTTGINSTIVLDKGLSEDPRFNSTFSYKWAPIGMAVGFDLSPRFGIQLEAIVANQGQIYDVVDIFEDLVGSREIDLSYVHIPLLMKFMNGSNNKARMNFSLGPQLSILTTGIEAIQYIASIQEIPDGLEIPQGSVDNGDGTYNVPTLPYTELLSSSAEQEVQKFKESEVQIAGSFGFDIDITKNLYLTTLVRINYSFTDMRNDELLKILEEGGDGAFDILGRRANVLIGLQFGVHFMIGGVRSRAGY
jgi:hypothetical protein